MAPAQVVVRRPEARHRPGREGRWERHSGGRSCGNLRGRHQADPQDSGLGDFEDAGAII